MKSDKLLQAQQAHGAMIWKLVANGRRFVDSVAWEVASQVIPDVDGTSSMQTSAVAQSVALAKWVDGGCRTITTDAKYFAAMAATRTGVEALEDLHSQWPSFVMQVPPGLLISGDGAEYRFALLADLKDLPSDTDFPTDLVSWMWIFGDDGACLEAFSNKGRVHLLSEATKVSNATGLEVAEGDSAVIEMTKRAMAGLLLTLEHTTNFRATAFRAVTRGSVRDSPPTHRTIFIGRPLQVDVTNAVREAASGRRGPPSVQTLVRGHMKRQVTGVNRIGRKVIWIEPYWRGPEDAPILARPYKVGPKEKP